MRLRLLPPSQDRWLDLLAAAADTVCQAATALCDLATDPTTATATATAAAARLLDLTHHSDRITSQLRSRLGSAVITPLDQTDLLTRCRRPVPARRRRP